MKLKKIIKKSKKTIKKPKNWKKITIFTLTSLTLSAIAATSTLLIKNKLSKNDVKSTKNSDETLISKIKDKDLIINKNVDTSTDAKILLAIKNQLKIENPLLNDKDLSKINDNISSLVPGVKTNVILIISVANKSNSTNVKIKVIRPLNDLESVSAVKNELENLSLREITINATSGTIIDNKKSITDALNTLIISSKINLKGTKISIKEEGTKLTFSGITFTILISKGKINQEITSKFIVKLTKNNVERNKEKIAAIKAKIIIKQFDINKNTDTSTDAKILLAIKNQLQKKNPLLDDEDLSKIDDNITFLVPRKKTAVDLIISVGSESDIVKIAIERPWSDLESVNKTKNLFGFINLKEVTISATSGTITSNKNLIREAIREISAINAITGAFWTKISIKEEDTELTLNGVPFTILVSRGDITKEIIDWKVKRSKTIQEINNDKVAKIKAKIVNKDLIIYKNVDTSNDAKILSAIKNQLKIQNPLLNNEDLLKINDNITSLIPGVKTSVVLTIMVGDQSDTIDISINRPLNDFDSVNIVKNKIEKLAPKEIQISATSGTITDNKKAIFDGFNLIIKFWALDLKGTIISIKNEDTKLTLNGVPFTILISKGSVTQKVVSFKIKRSKNIQEINNDKVAAIKNKIVDNYLIINKDIDTSNDAKILIAIKNQLKTQNPLLSDEDLSKITDNITSLVPGKITPVVLTILVGSESDVINIKVIRFLNDIESINTIKNKIVDKNLIINKNVDTSNDAKILKAIKNQLKIQNPSLSDEDLSKIDDNITSLVPGKITPVVLKILVGSELDNINVQVTKSSNELEAVNTLKNEFAKFSQRIITIRATSGTITENKKAIVNAVFHFLTRYSSLDYIEADISIKDEDTELTLNGVVFTILISKGNVTKEITNWKVKRSKTNQEINNDEIVKIKNKIVDKDLIINKNVDTSNDAKILFAIRNQLRVENPLLNAEDISKITDNINSLVPEVKTSVVLTISVGSQFDTINIQIKRSLSDLESVNFVKNELLKISQKITIRATSGTITENKEEIFNVLNLIIGFQNLDLKGTKISIKEENTKLTLNGVPFKILISKGSITQEIISKFIVARIKSIQEINNEKINLIKRKITDKELIINRNVDTSNDEKILLAIKNQLKIQNPSLNDEDLSKITDNITSLVPGKKTSVILRISIGSEFDTIKIKIIRTLSDLKIVNIVKNKFERLKLQRRIVIYVNGGTIADNKKTIVKALNSLINSSNINLLGTTVSLKEENSQITQRGTYIKILISKITVTREVILTAIFVKKSSI